MGLIIGKQTRMKGIESCSCYFLMTLNIIKVKVLSVLRFHRKVKGSRLNCTVLNNTKYMAYMLLLRPAEPMVAMTKNGMVLFPAITRFGSEGLPNMAILVVISN